MTNCALCNPATTPWRDVEAPGQPGAERTPGAGAAWGLGTGDLLNETIHFVSS